MSKSTLTRRNLVASAATMPIVAAATPSLAAGNDAELLRLGAELEQVGREWLKQRKVDAANRKEWLAACEAAGLPEKDYRDFADGDKLIAYQNRRLAVSRAETPNEVWDNFNERMFDLVEDILAHQPQTLPGLAVMVHAEVLDNSEYWELVGHAQNERLRTFLERLCTFLDIKPAPIRNRQ